MSALLGMGGWRELGVEVLKQAELGLLECVDGVG